MFGRFKVAIADLVPGQETDMWVELEPSDHKKHIRNHSEFHDNLDQKPQTNGSFPGDNRERPRKRRNSDPSVASTPADHSAHVNGNADQQDSMYMNGGSQQEAGAEQESGRDAFRPMHARQSRYQYDGHTSHGNAWPAHVAGFAAAQSRCFGW